MTASAEIQQNDDELSVSDVFEFIQEYWRVIALSGIFGILVAGIYLFITPPLYEATLQVEMARVSNETGNGAAELSRVPVEDAQLLVERLRLPSTYTPETATACGVGDAQFPLEALAARVRAKAIKGVNSVVEVVVPGESPRAVRSCATAIFNLVRRQQSALLQPLLHETSESIERHQQRLKENQEFLSTMEKTAVQSAVYLARRDESLWRMDQIAKLDRSLRQTSETKLVSPIYATSQPVSPKKMPALTIGAFTGIIFGTMISLLRRQTLFWLGRSK